MPGYFGAGLVDDIVCMLSSLREPVVISSNSTLMFRDQPTDLRRVRQELGVRYVVSGSIRRSGPQLRLAVELADAQSAAVLWAQPYDMREDLLFDAQDSIVALIVNTLVPRLQAAELRRARAKPPESLSAYELTLQARELIFRLDQSAFNEAGALLHRAVALDPGYAVAHALLSDWYALKIGQGWSADPSQDALAGDRMAQIAVEADPVNARALALFAHNKSFLYRNYASAQKLFGAALEAAPNDATAWMWSACTSAYIGDGRDAVSRAERALQLSPRDPLGFRYYGTLCLAHYTAGNYEQAAQWGQLGSQASPHYTSNLRFTTASLVAIGRMEEARETAQQILQVEPAFRAGTLLKRHPYEDPGARKRIADALVIAGIPA